MSDVSHSEGQYAQEDPPIVPWGSKPALQPETPKVEVPKAQGIWFEPIRVAGITNYVTSIDEVVGDEVLLEREPNNAFHAQAIVVHLVTQLNGVETKRKLGYVPRDFATMVLDSQLPVRGRIEWKSEPPIIAIKIRA